MGDRVVTTVVAEPPTGIVGSAEVLAADMNIRNTWGSEQWQDEGWAFWDISAELRAGVNWLGNALSKGRLVAARRQTGAIRPVPVPDGLVADVVSRVCGGIEGQAELLAASAVHLSIPGETYLVCDRDYTNWRCRSKHELEVRGTGSGGDGEWWERAWVPTSAENARWQPVSGLVCRSWRPHAKEHWRADSPVRALLPVLRELAMLNDHVKSTGESRLAGAGMLALPKEIDFPDVKGPNGETIKGVMGYLQWAMETALNQPGSAAAKVPITVEVPGEFLKAIQHIDFSTKFDEQVLPLREENRRRLAMGLDIPPEILMGLGGTNHWSAWQIEESALKLHVEPMLQAICMGLTVGFLYPTIKAELAAGASLDEGEKITDYLVWFDTSDLTIQPDNTDVAIRLGDRGFLSMKAVLREAGFADSDLPTAAEIVQLMALNSVRAHPELAPQLLPLIGIQAGLPALERSENDWVPIDQGDIRNPSSNDENEPEDGGGTDSAAPDTADNPPPAPNDTTDGGPVAASGDPADAPAPLVPDDVITFGDDRLLVEHQLLGAADAIVFRALERAGNRLRSWANGTPLARRLSLLPAHERHTAANLNLARRNELLDGAWVQVPDLARRVGVEPDGLVSVLDGYVAALFVTNTPHSYERLARHLAGAPCDDCETP